LWTFLCTQHLFLWHRSLRRTLVLCIIADQVLYLPYEISALQMRYLHLMKKTNFESKYPSALNVLYTILTFLLLSNLPACAQQKPNTSSISYDATSVDFKSLQNDILKLVNQHRAALGLNALQMSDAATTEAAKHSTDMAKGRMSFGHDGYDERMTNLNKKLGSLRATGENVAYGKINAEQVMDMWLNSPGHKKNIEGNFSMIGIGIAKSRSGYLYFTQIFLLK